jgi:aminopeptidase N
LSRLLDAGDDDPAFAALAMTPPSEIDLARELGHDVDPDILFAARKSLRTELGRALMNSLEQTYDRLTALAAYSPDAASAGKRSLRNVALDMIAAGDTAKGEALATRQFEDASNMTDQFAALSVLALIGGDGRETALAQFYNQYASDALVINKWFYLQAVIPEEATTERVRGLMKHPDFSLTNPNRVYSLISAFCNANPTRFHAADGSGYALLADVVFELDDKNPQVTARLLTALRSWRTLEKKRRDLAEQTLRRVLGKPSLSSDATDIVSRALS